MALLVDMLLSHPIPTSEYNIHVSTNHVGRILKTIKLHGAGYLWCANYLHVQEILRSTTTRRKCVDAQRGCALGCVVPHSPNLLPIFLTVTVPSRFESPPMKIMFDYTT